MARQRVRENQVAKPDSFDDQLSPSAIASSETATSTLDDFFNAVLSQVRRILGTTKWHDAVPIALSGVMPLPSMVALGASTALASPNANSYRGGGAGNSVAILPDSATITGTFRARFFVVDTFEVKVQTQGTDVISYYGQGSASLRSSTPGDFLEIEYAGNGLYVVTGEAGDGWVNQ